METEEKYLTSLIKENETRQGIHDPARSDHVERFRKWLLNEHWNPLQPVNERLMMKATFEHICNVPTQALHEPTPRQNLVQVYEFPKADLQATDKFVSLLFLTPSQAKACAAVLYDARDCDEEIVRNVVAKSTTRSVIRVNPKILSSIPPNDHLFYLDFIDEKGEEPAFVQRNRDRWWNQQTINSSTYYYTPFALLNGCIAKNKTIAHIFVFLATPATVHVHVIHRGKNALSVSIQENGWELGKTSHIPGTYQLHDFQPITLEQGRHELEVVPKVQDSNSDYYGLSWVWETFSLRCLILHQSKARYQCWCKSTSWYQKEKGRCIQICIHTK